MIAKKIKRTGKQCVTVTLPELLDLSRTARQLSFSASRIRSTQFGTHLSRFLGRGMEFAECRRYQIGDDIRTMDWRVTARTGKPHTKLFAMEKERQVLLCVDMRSSMFFATKGVFKSVQAALLSGYFSWNAMQNGNRLGGIIFDDSNLFEFRPTLGKRGVLPFLQSVAEHAHFPSSKKEDKSSVEDQMNHAIATIKRVSAPGSLVFIISDFRNFSTKSRDLLLQLSGHSDLCLCFTYDPFEATLPANGHFPLTDGNSELQLDTRNRRGLEKYQRQFMERKTLVTSLCNQRHTHFLECSTESDCFELLQKHFS